MPTPTMTPRSAIPSSGRSASGYVSQNQNIGLHSRKFIDHPPFHAIVYSAHRAVSSPLYFPCSDEEEPSGNDYPDVGEYDDYMVDNLDQGYQDEDDMEQDDSLLTGPDVGDICPHSPAGSESDWQNPVKIHATRGSKPKAGDYEVAVQNVLSSAIGIYRGYLSTVNPYPDPREEVRWALRAWKAGCEECDSRILSNREIIKLICTY